MREPDQPEGMLSPYRVLDLTDETGQPCGKLLADLGADVIKIEPPQGDPARRRAPFVDDDPDPEKSLYWLAYNANKRGLALDLDGDAGQAEFRRLVATADIVLESFAPGHLAAIGLGYAELAAINPRVVLVSITPFGQEGPHSAYRASDIVTWAMSGMMSISGESAGPPAQLSDNAQSYMHASGDAAIGALLALEQRRQTGRGQHVDVSMQEAVIRGSFQVAASWDMEGVNLPREYRPAFSQTPWNWRCEDGYVVYIVPAGPGASRRGGFSRWLEEIGEGEAFREIDWEGMDPFEVEKETWDAIADVVAPIFASRTKAELYIAANRHGFALYPHATVAETATNAQLEARDFWREIEHPELGRSIRYPGPFAQATLTPPALRRRAPQIGEHNTEIMAELDAAPPRPLAPLRQDGADTGDASAMPLAGLKVLDLSWLMVGPMTIKPLADYGADVVHIESSVRVDAQRTPGPFKGGVRDVELCGDYCQVRTSQRSITLDLSQPAGLAVAKRLVEWADVVVDNFAAGVTDRMGLGYEALLAINPEIIVLSCSGQGRGGPNAGSKGGGGHYVALAGFTELTGRPNDEPGYLSAYTDFIAPRFNVALLLGAVDYRRRTGQGQFFDVSQYETALHWLAPSLLDYEVNGRVATRLGNRQPHAAPHGAYRCRGDRWCAIAVTGEAEWSAFRTAIGDPAWANAARFASHEARKRHEDALDALVEEWTRRREPEDVMQTVQSAGVPAGVVQRGEDLLERDPQLRHRRFWQTLDHPALGSYQAPQHSFRLPEAPCELRRSRLTGEDTRAVLRDVLSMSDDEIAELAGAGVLQ